MGPTVIMAAFVAFQAVSSAGNSDAELAAPQRKWGLSSVTKDVHELEHSVADGATELRHSAKESADKFAHSVAEGAKEGAPKLGQTAHKFEHAAEDGAKDLGQGAKDLAKGPLVQSAKDFVKATKDKALREAASAMGLCEHSSREEKSKSEHQPVDAVGCEIVAEGVATAALTSRIRGVVATAVVERLSDSLVRHASNELCQSSHDWLAKHHALKAAEPLKYVAKLTSQLHKRVGPILDKSTARFCDRPEDLFADIDPVAPRRTDAVLPLALAGGFAGVALVLRLARETAREATQPICEESSEEA
mmetsp:Transcript_13195/g.31001  ORF Transcript_13195/g.31001 Transcript_13195/m.31001 type:complete len:305 (-) Transcript_13195:118-1032(-)|eukprot:CAMPEP_0171066420 /NCGR_PEP_ID=MMETSP0766_2-20121228/7409_1 /TAXON_ID=439317 /ORGANISM="Gambierdiscus australes, Strain CAWD 149" /LENGTH=304 /DNA_ID=CAMNT_0011522591 /DNA_START=65 /DNA_END=979 /DNA_ORIENTATION=+